MEKKGVIWNTLGSGVFAANSVLLLLIVSRVFGVAAAGDFGIVFTTAQILYIIGLFGINHFQMTDYAEQYSFASYRAAKWITTAAMICGCLVLLFFGGNTRKQAWLLLLLTMYMAVHSFAELYQSRFFQKNRLDLCGKSLFYRTFFSLCCFAVLSATIHNLYIASAVRVLTNLVTMYIWSFCPSKAMGAENRMGKKKDSSSYCFKRRYRWQSAFFLMNVMANLSKYVVNYYESNTVQGYFNILFLPTQVINLLSGFVFKPLLSQYGAAVGERDFIRFRQLYRRHLFLIGGLTVFCCLAGYLLGTQVLSLFLRSGSFCLSLGTFFDDSLRRFYCGRVDVLLSFGHAAKTDVDFFKLCGQYWDRGCDQRFVGKEFFDFGRCIVYPCQPGTVVFCICHIPFIFYEEDFRCLKSRLSSPPTIWKPILEPVWKNFFPEPIRISMLFWLTTVPRIKRWIS